MDRTQTRMEIELRASELSGSSGWSENWSHSSWLETQNVGGGERNLPARVVETDSVIREEFTAQQSMDWGQ